MLPDLASAQACRGMPMLSAGLRGYTDVALGLYRPALMGEVGVKPGAPFATWEMGRERTAQNGSRNTYNALRLGGQFGSQDEGGASGCAWTGFRADYGWIRNLEGTGYNARIKSYSSIWGVGLAHPLGGGDTLWFHGALTFNVTARSGYAYDRTIRTSLGRASSFRVGLQGGLYTRLTENFYVGASAYLQSQFDASSLSLQVGVAL